MENCSLSHWNRWVATNIFLDQSSPLGINGTHRVKVSGNLLLNLNLGELLALLKKLSRLDC